MVTDKEVEDLLISRCFVPSDLTPDEFEELREEIPIMHCMLDGVLYEEHLEEVRIKRRYGTILLDKSGDLDKLRELISKCEWTYAKTMPQCPHEYIVRGKCPLTDEEFLYFVDKQLNYGKPERWGKYIFPYLHVDGYKYWTMGDKYENTVIINRAKE